VKNLEGVCIRCKTPLLIVTESVTGRVRPFCPDCEKEMNEKVEGSMKRRGKKTKNKRLIFPKSRE